VLFRLIEILLKRLAGGEVGDRVVDLGFDLVVRGST